MTLAELQTKRDKILASIGIARTQFGERSTQYSDQQKALALIDGEIARVEAAAGNATPRTSYVEHSRD